LSIVYLTRRAHFSAAHRLDSNELDEGQNKSVYGICNNPLGHGHNYELEITLRGKPDPVTGMVMDLQILKKIIEKEIISQVDHQHLNYVPLLNGKVPTAENIVISFWDVLKDKIPNGELYEIVLYETPRNFIRYRGE
jgi:6-pyruvoyltetrahydropterin/6-carboxytetrahydropterin synthase